MLSIEPDGLFCTLRCAAKYGVMVAAGKRLHRNSSGRPMPESLDGQDMGAYRPVVSGGP